MPFRVLSIDGGGMRGIYSAAYLEALERGFVSRHPVDSLDIGKSFNLIAGTSTGAIIGCALASGVRPSEIIKLYKEHGPKIFPVKVPGSLGIDLCKQLRTRKKHLQNGENALREALIAVFGTTTLGELWDTRGIPMAIPAVKMSDYKPYLFKTPHNYKSDGRDSKYSLVDVCLASSAAPIFRSLAAIDHPSGEGHHVFADGGLWANNPVIVALIEALRILKEKDALDTEVEIYCLGSCSKPEGKSVKKEETARGLADWKFGGEAASLSLVTQGYAYEFIIGFLLPHLKTPVKVIPFPTEPIPASMMKYLDLDETSTEGLNSLVEKARTDAGKANSDIQHGTGHGPYIEALFTSMLPVAQ